MIEGGGEGAGASPEAGGGDVPPARSAPPWLHRALLWGMTALITLNGARYLYLRWANLDRAVFEADVYAQGMAHARHLGSYWPWILTEEFWPFLTMAPGLYVFIPLTAPASGGYPLLFMQCVALGLTAPLIARLAEEGGPLSHRQRWGATLLALAWLCHPIVGVGMAWGWAFYVFGGPLLLLGAWLMERRRFAWGALALLLAASMKVNVALAVAGLGLWAMLKDDRRPWGVWVLIGAGAWIALTGTVFLSGLLSTGRLGQDLHLSGGAPIPGWAGPLTLAVTALPLLPFLRRTWPLALAVAGLELAYTTVINPANSGLVGATAGLFLAAALGVPSLKKPVMAGLVALALALFGQQLYQPPVVSPLPLTPGAFTYEVHPRGQAIRAWIGDLDDDALLVVSESLAGAIGPHPGRTVRVHQWDGRLPARLLLEASEVPKGLGGCLREVFPKDGRWPALHGGGCQ